MAVLALAAVGAWLAPAGYAAIGWTIGSAIGTALFSKDRTIEQSGPRLTDLAIQTSTDGSPLAEIHGAARLAGNVIWAAELRETETVTSEDVGGKGGGGTTVSTTSYTYSRSFAVSVCKGPIVGIRRIWADSKLIYDISVGASPATIIAADALNLTIYLGTETQLPDPTIEAIEGVGNVPAYRGQAYVVFTDLQLANFGNRVPNFTFEPIEAGAYQDYDLVSSTELDILPNATNYIFQQAPFADDLGVHILSMDGYLIRHHVVTWNGDMVHVEDGPRVVDPSAAGWAMTGYSDEAGACWVDKTDAGANTITYVGPSGVFRLPVSGGYVATWAFCKAGDDIWVTNLVGNELQIYSLRHGMINYPAFTTTNYPSVDITQNYVYVYVANVLMRFDRASGVHQTTYTVTGEILQSMGLGTARAIADDLFRFINAADNQEVWHWTPSTNTSQKITTGIALASVTPPYLNQASIYGWQMYEINGVYAVWYAAPSAKGRVGVWARALAPTAVGLAGVVSEICAAAGLQPGEINVSALSGNVDGYVLTQPMPARAALEPLMRAHFFDAIESGTVIKFVPRGGAAAAALPVADLAAHGDGDTMPDAIVIERTQERELPREVVVLYMDAAADYQQGTQSARRLVTDGRAVLSVEMAMVLSADRARQIAEVLLADAWMARSAYPLSLPPQYIDLEPTDVITLADTSATHTVRIIDQEIGANGVIRAQAVAESAAAYTSTATGAAPNIPGQSLSLVGPTSLQLLDVPLLRDVDDAPGFYLAAGGLVEDWKGALIQQSRDVGESWSLLATQLVGAITGYAIDVLPSGRTETWDRTSTVTVRIRVGELSSVSELNVLNGDNAALLGAHGRWEIIQFASAVLNSDGTYTLSTLLRGRRGTEWAAGLHQTADVFVLLTAQTLRNIRHGSEDIGRSLLYRALSVGSSGASAAPVSFSNTGVLLKPLSPVHARVSYSAGGVPTITWVRRTRKGGEWRDRVDAALGETSERYEVDIVRSSGTVARTLTATSPSVTLSAYTMTATMTVTSELVYAKYPRLAAFDSTNMYLIGQDYKLYKVLVSTMGLVVKAPLIGIWEDDIKHILAANGYVYVLRDAATSTVLRVDTGTLAVAASYDSSDTVGGLAKLFFAGGYLWVALRPVASTTSKLRKLDPLTLAVVTEIDVADYAWQLTADATYLYIVCSTVIKRVHLGTDVLTSLATTFTEYGQAASAVVAGGALYVACSNDSNLYKHSLSTGALQLTVENDLKQFYTYPEYASPNEPEGWRYGAPFSPLLVADASFIYFETLVFDASTAAFVSEMPDEWWTNEPANSKTRRNELAGIKDGRVYIKKYISYENERGEGVYDGTVAEYSKANDLGANTVKIYQMSDAVGRGYPLTVTF